MKHSSLLKIEPYEQWGGTQAERMYLVTHVPLAQVLDPSVDYEQVEDAVDSLMDRMFEGLNNHRRELPDHAIVRVSLEVDVEPVQEEPDR